MEDRAYGDPSTSEADRRMVLWSLEVEGVGFQVELEALRPLVMGAIIE